MSQIDITNGVFNAWQHGIIEPKRQDVLTTFTKCSRLCSFPFPLCPKLAGVVSTDKHETVTCFVLIDIRKMRVEVSSPERGLLVFVIENGESRCPKFLSYLPGV